MHLIFLENICHHAKDPGPCEAYMPSFYYESEELQCKRFIYGGCRGSANRFQTFAECSMRCNGIEDQVLFFKRIPPN